MANTKLPARLLDTSAIPALNVTGDLTVDTTTLKVDSTNNRVGIGTASPGYTFDVDSTVHIGNDAGTSYTHSRLIFDSNGSVRGAGNFYHNQANDVEWFAGNVYNLADSFSITRNATASHTDATADITKALFVINSSGNVGIGATPETWKSGWEVLRIGERASFYSQTSTTAGIGENIYYDNGSNWRAIANAPGSLYQLDSGDHHFYTMASVSAGAVSTPLEKLTILQNGNVGIGNSSPDGIFHVKTASGVHRSRFESASSHSLVRLIAGTGSNAGLEFYSGSGNVGNITVDSTSNIIFEPSGTEKMRLSSGGILGINNTTVNTDSNLHSHIKAVVGGGVAVGSAAATSNSFLQYADAGGLTVLQGSGSYGLRVFDDNSTTPRFTVMRSGNVGIGTSSPSRKLEVLLTSTNGSLHSNSNAAAHFGSAGNADGHIQGISLGYKTSGANSYSKTAIVARGHNDGAARQSLAFLVDTAADGGSAEIGDSKLTIDGLNGSVTMPGQPFFQANGSGGAWTTVSSENSWNYGIHNNTASYWNEGTDRGSGHFNPSNGRFTAPVSGWYMFQCSIYVRNTNGVEGAYLHPQFFKNGVLAYQNGKSPYKIIQTNSSTNPEYMDVQWAENIYLTATQYVTVNIYFRSQGNWEHYPDYSVFTGGLIS